MPFLNVAGTIINNNARKSDSEITYHLVFKPFCIKGFHCVFVLFDGVQLEVQPKHKSMSRIIVAHLG